MHQIQPIAKYVRTPAKVRVMGAWRETASGHFHIHPFYHHEKLGTGSTVEAKIGTSEIVITLQMAEDRSRRKFKISTLTGYGPPEPMELGSIGSYYRGNTLDKSPDGESVGRYYRVKRTGAIGRAAAFDRGYVVLVMNNGKRGTETIPLNDTEALTSDEMMAVDPGAEFDALNEVKRAADPSQLRHELAESHALVHVDDEGEYVRVIASGKVHRVMARHGDVVILGLAHGPTGFRPGETVPVETQRGTWRQSGTSRPKDVDYADREFRKLNATPTGRAKIRAGIRKTMDRCKSGHWSKNTRLSPEENSEAQAEEMGVGAERDESPERPSSVLSW